MNKLVDVPRELKDLLTKEVYSKARLYALDRNNFSNVKSLFSTFVTTVSLFLFSNNVSLNHFQHRKDHKCSYHHRNYVQILQIEILLAENRRSTRLIPIFYNFDRKKLDYLIFFPYLRPNFQLAKLNAA